MTQKEQTRLQVLNSVLADQVPVCQAAEVLGVSERHTRRILAAYRKEGAAALAHGNRGRRPANTTTETKMTYVVQLARTRYAGTNHTVPFPLGVLPPIVIGTFKRCTPQANGTGWWRADSHGDGLRHIRCSLAQEASPPGPHCCCEELNSGTTSTTIDSRLVWWRGIQMTEREIGRIEKVPITDALTKYALPAPEIVLPTQR